MLLLLLLLLLAGLPKRLSMSISKSCSGLAGCIIGGGGGTFCCCCCCCCCCLDNPGGLATTATPPPPLEEGKGSFPHSGASTSSSSSLSFTTFFFSTSGLRGGTTIPCSFKYLILSASNRAASPSSGTNASSNPPLLTPFNLLAPRPPADGISQ